MISIAVGGQLEKQTIARMVETLGGEKVSVAIMSDLDGVLAVQTGQAHYYLGACHTGAGGALGLALGLLGPAQCVSLCTPGGSMDEREIDAQVSAGKRAFGMVADLLERQLPPLVAAILRANP